jgi:hypothetical protein
MKPQEGIGCPSAPLRRRPDGLEFWLQGIMLKVAPVSTKYLSFVNSSVKKINPALAGKCIALAVACVGMAAESKVVWQQISFLTKHRSSAPVSLVGVVVVKFTNATARVLKRIEIRAGRGLTFRTGVAALFVALLPAARSRAPTALSRGSCNCGVVAASSIPQGVRSLHHGCGCRVGASSYRFSHGRW